MITETQIFIGVCFLISILIITNLCMAREDAQHKATLELGRVLKAKCENHSTLTGDGFTMPTVNYWEYSAQAVRNQTIDPEPLFIIKNETNQNKEKN